MDNKIKMLLCKAKTRSSNEWIEGLVSSLHAYSEKGVETCYFYELRATDGKIESFQHIVSTKTICRNTGRCYSSGRTVWEYDIVRVEDENDVKLGVVVWDAERAAFGIDYQDGTQSWLSPDIEHAVYIGCLIDNPDLIEGW